MTAKDVIKLLQSRHSKDVFFSEIAVDGRESKRMDGWALKPSYTQKLVTGYEVKVSRSDFLQDNKMYEYMGYCNQMYLVAPAGVCRLEEIPEGFGFVLATENRLLTKKKAPYREVEIPESFYRGLLCNRAKNDFMRMSDMEIELHRRVGMISTFENYVEGKYGLKELGSSVAKKLYTDSIYIEEEKQKIESMKNEKEHWEKFSNALRKEFGYHIMRDIRNGLYDSAMRDVKERLEKLNHPEKDLFDTIELFKEKADRLKELLA